MRHSFPIAVILCLTASGSALAAFPDKRHPHCDEFTRNEDGSWMMNGPSLTLSSDDQKTKDVYFLPRRSVKVGDVVSWFDLDIAALLNEACQ